MSPGMLLKHWQSCSISSSSIENKHQYTDISLELRNCNLKSGYEKLMSIKIVIYSYLSVKTCVLDAQKNHLNEMRVFEDPQHMFWLMSKKIDFKLSTFI